MEKRSALILKEEEDEAHRRPGCPLLPCRRLCLEKEGCKYQLLQPDKALQVLLVPRGKSQAPVAVLCVGGVPGHSQQELWGRAAAGVVFSGITEILMKVTGPASVQPQPPSSSSSVGSSVDGWDKELC